MLTFDSQRRMRKVSLAVVVSAVAAVAMAGKAEANWLTNILSGGTSNSDTAPDISQFLKPEYCPAVEIRVGTEALMVYERGHEGDEDFVRFEGSLEQPVRECHTVDGTMTIKVGVSGRLVAGPKGTGGNFTVPLRVTVVRQHDNSVLFSQVQKAPVSISGPTFASDYKYVFDNITFKIAPDDRDLIVYLGYDQGKPKKPVPTG